MSLENEATIATNNKTMNRQRIWKLMGSGVTDGEGVQMPPWQLRRGAPFKKWASLIRLPLLPKQLSKVETFISSYKIVFATAAVSCKALRKCFFKWYLHCQDC